MGLWWLVDHVAHSGNIWWRLRKPRETCCVNIIGFAKVTVFCLLSPPPPPRICFAITQISQWWIKWHRNWTEWKCYLFSWQLQLIQILYSVWNHSVSSCWCVDPLCSCCVNSSLNSVAVLGWGAHHQTYDSLFNTWSCIYLLVVPSLQSGWSLNRNCAEQICTSMAFLDSWGVHRSGPSYVTFFTLRSSAS